MKTRRGERKGRDERGGRGEDERGRGDRNGGEGKQIGRRGEKRRERRGPKECCK